MNTSQPIILTNAIITDGYSWLIPDATIDIRDGRFVFVGPTRDYSGSTSGAINIQGRLVLPGLLNPHHHLYSALATGLAPVGPMTHFTQILANLWWRLDCVLDEETIYYSALSGLIQSVRYGVTTVFDHHASMRHMRGSLGLIEKAFQTVGIRGVLCYEISDRMGAAAVQEQIDENLQFWENHRNHPEIQGLLGLHANFTLGEPTMELLQDVKPPDMPIHIHCGEDQTDLRYCVTQGFAGPVDRLHRFGLLDQNSLLAHCIHLSATDYALISDLRPVVISNPESNANNRVGVMDLSQIDDYMLGTDGMTGNILGTLRSHYLLRQGEISDPLQMMFTRPAQLIQRFFPDCGRLAPGYRADLAITDYIPVTEITLGNLFYHLVFGVQGRPMFATLANGKMLYSDHTLQHLDEIRLSTQIRQAAQQLHRRYYE